MRDGKKKDRGEVRGRIQVDGWKSEGKERKTRRKPRGENQREWRLKEPGNQERLEKKLRVVKSLDEEQKKRRELER